MIIIRHLPQSEISFDGNGYLEFDKKLISYDAPMEMIMSLEFSTWEPNGLLIWQGDNDQYFAIAG